MGLPRQPWRKHFENSGRLIAAAVDETLETKIPPEILDPRGYRAGYAALSNLVQLRTDWKKPTEVLAAILAVYGWMPKIVGAPDEPDLIRLAQYVSKFGLHTSVPTFLENLDAVAKHEDSILCLLNNSTVGTSKLLHFAHPHLFPIWDSVVASIFGVSEYYLREAEVYASYTRAMHLWLDSNVNRLTELDEKLSWFQHGETPLTPLRLVENALFIAAKLRDPRRGVTYSTQPT